MYGGGCSLLLFFIYKQGIEAPSSIERKVYTFIMGDALIVGRGGGSSSSKYELKTEIYEADKLWVVPKAKDQKFSVRIFGGGGVTNLYSTTQQYTGGGGGYMNNSDLTLSEGSTVQITIGLGGNNGQDSTTGGITSFGTYLSANGGTGGYKSQGGSGGSGGGGVCNEITQETRGGGDGQQFGGGGGGGNGGYWGGGGGCEVPLASGTYRKNSTNGGISINYQYNTSNGQWYDGGGGGKGGNGATPDTSTSTYIAINANNGTDTTSIIDNTYISGKGIAGNTVTTSSSAILGGGGGGYGGNGGNNCGGGGGYGADGGSGIIIRDGRCYLFGGGGGGYGKGGYGGNAKKESLVGYCGGGGAYGPGGDGKCNGVRGGGAGGGGISGGNGICIIQYYA